MTISAPTNPALILDDGAITYAPTGGGTFTRKGTVAGVRYVYDTGSDPVPKTFVAALQASVLKQAVGNEQYIVTFEGGAAVAIDGDGNTDLTGEVRGLDEWSMSVKDQQDIRGISTLDPLDNTLWRYLRVSIQVSGTAPQIALTAWLRPLSDMEPFEFAELTQLYVFTSENIQNALACFLPWASGVAGGGPENDGRYPWYDGFGHSLLVKCPAQMVAEVAPHSPFEFGAIGDGESHPASGYFATLPDLQVKYPFASSLWQEMDFLAWQAALYQGGRIECQPHTFVMCNGNVQSQTPLIAIAGTFEAFVSGSQFTYPGMIEQTDDTEYLLNANFANGSAWQNATIFDSSDILMTTFGGGFATMTDTGDPATGQRTYYNWGEEVTLQPGRYTMTAICEATLGPSYYLGNVDPGYASIGFSATSPGEGGNPIGKESGGRFNISPDHPTDTRLFTTSFQIDEAITVWANFQGGGFASIKCSEFSIKKWIANCGILATRDGSPQHFPIPRGFDGLELIGPTPFEINGITGVRYKSFTYTDGNVLRFTNSMISEWGRGLSYGDGAYLTDFDNVNVYYCGTGIYTELGTLNAGENLRWYGGGIANSVVGIDNQAGFEISFYGAILDYCYQSVINNVGRIELHGVHVETHRPVEADKPTFHMYGGQITMFGGMVLLIDETLASPCAPIKTEFSTAVFECFGTELYNVSSDPNGAGKGAMMDGPGQLVTHGWRNSGNPNIGPVCVSYAPIMDVLGGAGKFPEPNIYTRDPTGILLKGGAFPDTPPQVPFTGFITGSKLTIEALGSINEVEEGMQVRAPGIKGVPLLSFIPGGATGGVGDYLISIPQNVASRAMTAGDDGRLDRWSNRYGTLVWSDDYTLNGSNCLKFTKGIGATSLNSAIRILIDATPGCVSLGFVNFLFPVDYAPVDPDETHELYFRLFWVRSIGNDEYGSPIIVRELFAGYTTMNVPRAGSPNWQRILLSTTYSPTSGDPLAEARTHSPEWATDLAIYLDNQALPDGQVWYMADLVPNFLR